MKLIIFIVFFVIHNAFIDCEKGVHQITIRRGESKAEKLVRLGQFDELKRIHQLATTSQQQLDDLFDDYYVGTITVGTPGAVTSIPLFVCKNLKTMCLMLLNKQFFKRQTYWISFISAFRCADGYRKCGFVACIEFMHYLRSVHLFYWPIFKFMFSAGMSPYYNPQSSSSSVNLGTKWSIGYIGGTANGTLVKDKVCIGSLCYQTQVMVIISKNIFNEIVCRHLVKQHRLRTFKIKESVACSVSHFHRCRVKV